MLLRKSLTSSHGSYERALPMVTRTLLGALLVVGVLHAEDGAYVGVRAKNLTQARAAELKITPVRGAEITLVNPDSPASKAGILVGDVILAYEAVIVNDATDLQTFIRQTPGGSSVRFGVLRNGHRIVVPVQTGVRAADASTSSSPVSDLSDLILGCLNGAGIVIGAELAFTALVCGAEIAFAGETSLCEALLNTVLDDAPGTALKACVAGAKMPLAKAK